MPIVSAESVFITASVDAHECRDVAAFYILGAYLHTETDKDLFILM